ncbi:pectate lyase family protein [Bacillus sp. UNC41MFS5]|uniref:pectate lyase family protein n=1 Tax=Bacillus sp. UNC41MFS5 TaxID=1449046 RepID=UPI0012DE9F9A
MHQIASNKTILGLGNNAQITNGGLYLSKVENVIIQNISFSNASDDSISRTKIEISYIFPHDILQMDNPRPVHVASLL